MTGPMGTRGPDIELTTPGLAPTPVVLEVEAEAGHPTRGPIHSTAASGHSRRWSLRSRLMALILAATATMMVVVDIVLPTVVHGALLDERDATLRSVLAGLSPNIDLAYLQRTVENNPLRSGIGWTVFRPDSITSTQPEQGQDSGGPAIPTSLPTSPETLAGDDGTGSFRVLGRQMGPNLAVLVWTPLDDVDKTVDRLILVEVIITIGLLILIGSIAGFLIRRELKPIEDMAEAADAIAAGDLTRRVDPGVAGVEVDRLGHAFNGMLDGIEDLLTEREANEERLRQFIADASHELRTPVAAVRGYTDLYRAGALPEEAAVGRAMERMGFESKRMAALVEDLLTLARADSEHDLPRDPVNLGELLKGVVDDARVIDQSRRWELLYEPGSYFIAGDRLRLHQVFANLLANIRTHTPEGTTALVTLRGEGDQVVVEVLDDGPGVDDAVLHRLFDRFFRADPSRSREKGGSGLGLSIVAAIVKTHGGTVQAGRSGTGGMAIRVALPVWRRSEGDSPARPNS
ncbi:sensor histidine kinase [Nakamurella silvestris]|nr:sensor histidine kinase [Nakamurella silvestris]